MKYLILLLHTNLSVVFFFIEPRILIMNVPTKAYLNMYAIYNRG